MLGNWSLSNNYLLRKLDILSIQFIYRNSGYISTAMQERTIRHITVTIVRNHQVLHDRLSGSSQRNYKFVIAVNDRHDYTM